MARYDLVTNREPHTDASALGCEEVLEDATPKFGSDSRARIHNIDNGLFSLLPCMNSDSRTWF